MSRAFLLLWRISVVLCFLYAVPSHAASLFDPALRFQTLTSDHFVIYFHQRDDRSARRLAAIAEETWQRLREPFAVTPPNRTHVILADQTDVSNGWATPLPHDIIMVTSAWPSGSEFIGRTEDWLRLVFTHEFTHIVHLDRSEGWARIVRGTFGRVRLAFPNLFLPVWQIEGLATYEESRLTGEGRFQAGDFRAIEREAARAGKMEPLDRVNGGLTSWPDGLAPYAYGLGFHAYLAARYGDDTIAQMANATASRIPYTSSRVFKKIYGRPLGALWRDYEEAATAAAPRATVVDRIVRLTRQGYVVAGPRFAPPACERCESEIVYAARNPNGFPALNAIGVDGSRSRRLTTRYLGSTSGVSATTIVFDQQEVRRNAGLYGDLYAFDRASGRVRALTSNARLLDPDLSPDGQSIACVREGNGQRELVLVRLKPDTTYANGFPNVVSAFRRTVSEVTALVSEPDTQFNAPRWSPDGRRLAVERHRPGALSEIVVLDVATKELKVVASLDSRLIVTPTWRPDGDAIIAAADVEDGPFNLYEFSIDRPNEGRQLTHTTGGAIWPDVSPDGRTIVFAGYTVDGFDLFTMPYPEPEGSLVRSVRLQPDLTRVRLKGDTTGVSGSTTISSASVYSPWPTMRPTSWQPIIDSDGDQVRAGLATGGFDVLGYHGYAVWATWLVDGPDAARRPRAATPDWQAVYAYQRWRPTFFVSASTRTSFFAGPPTATGASSDGTARKLELEAGVLMPFSHVRVSHRAFASFLKSADRYTLQNAEARVNRVAARFGWATTSAHVYGYSISPEGGVRLGATAELVRKALGSSDDATTVAGDFRAYLPGASAHHVVAVRAGGGTSTGALEARKTFLLGGAAASLDVLDFSSDAFRLLRAFPSATFAGTHVALVNAEYRAPLVRPERGIGTWPLFLRTIDAAIFADAGHAWTNTFHAGDIKTSFGGEISFDVIAGYVFPFTATFGAARGRDGAASTDSSAFYFRFGRAF